MKTNEHWKKLFKELLKDSITVRRQSELTKLFEDRVDTIWNFICEKADIDLGWYAFDNCKCVCTDELDYGFFDPVQYYDFIRLCGDWDNKKMGVYKSGFPTELLWDDDWQERVVSVLEICQAEELDKRLDKLVQAELRAHCLDKIKLLPTEELNRIVNERGL